MVNDTIKDYSKEFNIEFNTLKTLGHERYNMDV